MAIDFGRNLVMSIGPTPAAGPNGETVYNTYVGTDHLGFTVLPGSRLSFEHDIREEMSARGKAAMSPYDMAAGLRRWGYDGSFNLPKEGLGYWLYYTFGCVTSSVISGGFYKHIIDVNDPAIGTDGTPPSISVRLLDDNREWHLAGGHVKSLELVMSLDNFWRVNFSLIGGTYANTALGAAPSYTVPAAGRYYLTSDDFDFKVNTAGAANWPAANFSVKFERNYAEDAEASYTSGSAERVRLASAGAPAFTCTGSTRSLYSATTTFDTFDAYTQFRVEAVNKTVAGENLVAVSTAGYALKVALEKCYAVAWDKEDAGGITLQKLDFRATYDTAATDIEVTTQDKLATPITQGTP